MERVAGGSRQGAAAAGSTPLRVLIAGGGTGGHVYPGLAVAAALLVLVPQAEVRFAGSRRGIESVLVPRAGYRFHPVPASGFRGKRALARLMFIVNFQLGIWCSLGLLVRWRPAVVLGTGGYVSAPVMLAARMLRIRCALQEQNAVPGTANRLVAHWARRIYLGMADAAVYFPADRCRVTGNPVRPEFLRSLDTAEPATGDPPPAAQVTDERRVLMFGGTRGAHTLNVAMAGAAEDLRDLENLALWLQTGTEDRQVLTDSYADWSARARVAAYLTNMPTALRWAQLVVCRAGAMTLAELAVAARPSILVPYPHATDDHQLRNARQYEQAGAALVIEDKDCSAATLAMTLRTLLADPERLRAMAEAAGGLARPEAAREVAQDLLELAGHVVTDTTHDTGDQGVS